jgi:hypothetical protein
LIVISGRVRPPGVLFSLETFMADRIVPDTPQIELDYDLQRTLKWCEEHGTLFKITAEDGLLAVSAKCENIYADYVVEPPFNAQSLGNAVWAAIFAVKHGTEFHKKFGHYPPVAGGDPTPGVGDSNPQQNVGPARPGRESRPGDNGSVSEPAAPSLHTGKGVT